MITRNRIKDFHFGGLVEDACALAPTSNPLPGLAWGLRRGAINHKKRSWLARKGIAERREKGSLCKTITFNKNPYFTVSYRALCRE